MGNYGSVSHDHQLGTDTTNHRNHEERALLSQKPIRQPISRQVHKHLSVDVDNNHGDLILLLCYIITGFLDSCATAVWGSFVSMQTGNTIFLGLGLADPSSSSRWIKSGMSIALFCLGSFCFARFHRYFSPKKRWVLATSFAVQCLLIVGAASVTVFTPKATSSEHDLHWHVLVPLGMVAFQSSGQAVTSRVLQHDGLTSVVLTSIYCDLFSDAKLLSWPSENAERNRRAAAPIMLLIGAVCGGLWSRSEIGLAGALWTAAALKALIVVAWLVWESETNSDEAEDE